MFGIIGTNVGSNNNKILNNRILRHHSVSINFSVFYMLGGSSRHSTVGEPSMNSHTSGRVLVVRASCHLFRQPQPASPIESFSKQGSSWSVPESKFARRKCFAIDFRYGFVPCSLLITLHGFIFQQSFDQYFSSPPLEFVARCRNLPPDIHDSAKCCTHTAFQRAQPPINSTDSTTF